MKMFDALAGILSEKVSPVKVFFRDDDAGWADQRLAALCECFIECKVPLDIAAIPTALGSESAGRLKQLIERGRPWLHIHQHGYTHINHQQQGRSCEFGSERSAEQQYQDIAQGRDMLKGLFADDLELLFTPPWNRCTNETVQALETLGFHAISRITHSEPLKTELPEIDVSIDWLKKRKGRPLSAEQIVQLVCAVFGSEQHSIGVMLHHEHMDTENLAMLMELIKVLQDSPQVSFVSMQELAA